MKDIYSCLLKPLNSLRNIGPQQGTQFCEVLFSSAHVILMAFITASVLLCQVSFGFPTFRFPCGFQSRACMVRFEGDFQSVWPIHPHFLFLISISMGLWPVLSQRSLLEMTSGHLMSMMFLRHLSIKVWSLWVSDLVVLHVSEPYSSRHDAGVEDSDLVVRERTEEFQMGQRVLNACLALLIRLLISLSVPPSLLMTLPM